MVFFDANVYAASTFLHGKRVSDHAKDILPLVYDVVVHVRHHPFRVPHQVRNFLDAYLRNPVAQLRAVIVAEDVGSQPVNDRKGIRAPGSAVHLPYDGFPHLHVGRLRNQGIVLGRKELRAIKTGYVPFQKFRGLRWERHCPEPIVGLRHGLYLRRVILENKGFCD